MHTSSPTPMTMPAAANGGSTNGGSCNGRRLHSAPYDADARCYYSAGGEYVCGASPAKPKCDSFFADSADANTIPQNHPQRRFEELRHQQGPAAFVAANEVQPVAISGSLAATLF